MHSDMALATIGRLVGETAWCAVLLTKGTSPNFALALGLMGRVDQSYAVQVDGRDAWISEFRKERGDTLVLDALLRLIHDWKTAFVSVNGRLLSSQEQFEFRDIVSCYAKSTEANDMRAFCHCVVSEMFDDEYASNRNVTLSSVFHAENAPERYIYPCKKISHQTRRRYSRAHPASLADQVQAHAVERGISACPNFDVRALIRLPL